jgi:tryptophan-rich sensory protein
MGEAPKKRITSVDWIILLAVVALCYAVAAVGGVVTATSVDTWYPTLAKPALTPPDWVFAPTWLTLYGMLAGAAWLVYLNRRKSDVAVPLSLFVIQLIVNLAWPLLFFGFRWIDGALVSIALLFALVTATTVTFWRVSMWAGLLLVPYLVWVGFAAYLNAGIWRLN